MDGTRLHRQRVFPRQGRGKEKRLLALHGAVFGHSCEGRRRMPYSKDGPLKQAAATALPLFALLLFNAPDGVTLRTLLPFHGLGERSHQ